MALEEVTNAFLCNFTERPTGKIAGFLVLNWCRSGDAKRRYFR